MAEGRTAAREQAKEERKMRVLVAAVAIIAASAGAAAAQDAQKGEQDFTVCRPCHAIGPDAANMLGPQLNGLDGRHAGSVPGYSYSDANKNSGIVWNQASFTRYIQNPQAVVPGTKMFFAGVKDQQQIKDLWAYLSQFDAEGNTKNK
jgi:cytochrome c